jgi:hypothetical protein
MKDFNLQNLVLVETDEESEEVEEEVDEQVEEQVEEQVDEQVEEQVKNTKKSKKKEKVPFLYTEMRKTNLVKARAEKKRQQIEYKEMVKAKEVAELESQIAQLQSLLKPKLIKSKPVSSAPIPVPIPVSNPIVNHSDYIRNILKM